MSKTEISNETQLPPYTYAGLLDDVMLRYSDEFTGRDFFRKMIAKNVLFGGGIFINDGYLVNHPIAREHLMNNRSLLHVMLVAGFVRILTRTDHAEALARMPIAMAESGNQSFQRLIKDPEWDDFGPAFKKIAEHVFRTGTQRPWPNVNMSYGYAKLMEQHFIGKTAAQMGLSVLDTDDVRFISDNFLELNPRQGNARDKFERAAARTLEKRNRFTGTAMREIMEVANQCYHYNFGLAMTEDPQVKKEGTGIAVDTTTGKTFDSLLATEPVTKDQIRDIPLMGIPKELPFDDGEFFLPFLDTTSEIYQAKIHYLQQLNRLLSSGLSEAGEAQLIAARKDTEDARDAYARRASAHLAKKIYGLDAFRYQGTGHTGEQEEGLATVQLGLIIRLSERDQSADRTRDLLFKRFSLKDESQSLAENEAISINDIRPQIASLGFDRSVAKEFLDDVPRMVP